MEHPPPPLAVLGEPLLDDEHEEWSDPHEELYGPIDPDRMARIASRMQDCTSAVSRLAANLVRLRSNYSMRYMVLGLCCWLFAYMMRQGNESPLLLVDALQGRNPRIRSQSRATYARALDHFSRATTAHLQRMAGRECARRTGTCSPVPRKRGRFWMSTSAISAYASASSSRARRWPSTSILSCRLTRFGSSPSVCSDEGEVLRLPEFAEQLRNVWSILVGAEASDGEVLRSNRFGPLDHDGDLRPNADEFQALLVRLVWR